jgi:cell wall-associated NlpC family hydrolase
VRFTPLLVLICAAIFTWAAVGATKSGSSKRQAPSEEDATPRPKKGATPKPNTAGSDDEDAKSKPKSSPVKKKAAADDEATPKPKPKATPSRKKTTSSDDDSAATPHPNTPKTKVDEKSDAVKKKEFEETLTLPKASATPAAKGAPPASIEPTDLAKYQEQPERVKQLIDAALALSKQGLTYKYGSDDPANGGMDCSGSVAYLLRLVGL